MSVKCQYSIIKLVDIMDISVFYYVYDDSMLPIMINMFVEFRVHFRVGIKTTWRHRWRRIVEHFHCNNWWFYDFTMWSVFILIVNTTIDLRYYNNVDNVWFSLKSFNSIDVHINPNQVQLLKLQNCIIVCIVLDVSSIYFNIHIKYYYWYFWN